MKIFSACCSLVIGISTMALAGCSAPKANIVADGAPQLAAVKCKRAADAPLGTMIKKDCADYSNVKTVNTEDFLNSLQVPGSFPTTR